MSTLTRLAARACRALGLRPAPPEHQLPVRAQAVGPSADGPSQLGASQIGASRIGASQIGASQIGASQIGASQIGPGASPREVARVRADIAAARALVEVNRRLGEPTRPDVAALAQVEPSSPQVAVIAAQRAQPADQGDEPS